QRLRRRQRCRLFFPLFFGRRSRRRFFFGTRGRFGGSGFGLFAGGGRRRFGLRGLFFFQRGGSCFSSLTRCARRLSGLRRLAGGHRFGFRFRRLLRSERCRFGFRSFFRFSRFCFGEFARLLGRHFAFFGFAGRRLGRLRLSGFPFGQRRL